MFHLFPKPQFIRASAKLTKKNPALDTLISKTLESLKNEPFAHSLKTHKLKGDLEGKYACSLTHDLRIVFEITSDTIHLFDIGSHDEVY